MKTGKINWMQKLASRKFWLALVNFVTNILVAVNVPENQIAQVAALIMAGAGLIAYVLAEGFVDAVIGAEKDGEAGA
jgi:uncharacterized membrane protein